MTASALHDHALDYLQTRSGVLYIETDPDGVVRDMNARAREKLGDAAVGKPLANVVVDFANTCPLDQWLSTPTGPVMMTIETVLGMPESLHFTFRPAGDAVAVFGEVDQAEIDLMRDELLHANQEVNNLARQLQKRNAELGRLNDLKNEFLGMAAHDLRSPVGNIASLSELLLSEAELLPAESLEYLTLIRSLSEFVMDLLESLLDLTAIESGKLNMVWESVDMPEVLNRSVALHRMRGRRDGIELAVEVDGDLPMFTADANKLAQVFDNLISNAMKFSHSGTTVTIRAEETGENEIAVHIEDQGPGIPEEELAELFQPFRKTSVRTARGEKSTGLGLAIVKKIVAAHRGRVWATSTLGQGTTMHVALPTTHVEKAER
jgi:signal transduction histidine kinase